MPKSMVAESKRNTKPQAQPSNLLVLQGKDPANVQRKGTISPNFTSAINQEVQIQRKNEINELQQVKMEAACRPAKRRKVEQATSDHSVRIQVTPSETYPAFSYWPLSSSDSEGLYPWDALTNHPRPPDHRPPIAGACATETLSPHSETSPHHLMPTSQILALGADGSVSSQPQTAQLLVFQEQQQSDQVLQGQIREFMITSQPPAGLVENAIRQELVQHSQMHSDFDALLSPFGTLQNARAVDNLPTRNFATPWQLARFESTGSADLCTLRQIALLESINAATVSQNLAWIPRAIHQQPRVNSAAHLCQQLLFAPHRPSLLTLQANHQLLRAPTSSLRQAAHSSTIQTGTNNSNMTLHSTAEAVPSSCVTISDVLPSDSICLASEDDEGRLSRYQIMVRKQLEFFAAKQDDLKHKIQGRKRPLQLGQVGVQCRHCAHLPLPKRGRGSVYYPSKLDGVYQAAQNMASSHLIDSCNQISDEARQELQRLRECHETASGGKAYWAQACARFGIYESEHGLQLGDPSTLSIRRNSLD